MTKVSVVIPCYNQGRFLDEAVESILKQTFDEFEIIVVNDGSDDPDTIELLKQYDRPQTRVIHTPNQGLPSARNAGIREAEGKYILPLDADDRIGPEYLEKAVAILDSDPEVGIVYCRAEFFGEKTGPWDLSEYNLPQMLVENLIFCSGMFRKEDWSRAGGYNANMIYGWEDWDFWLSILTLDRKVFCIPEVLFYYRVTEKSMGAKVKEEKEALMRLSICNNHPGLYRNLVRMKLTPIVAKLYVDTGKDFNEKESLSQVIAGNETSIEFDLSRFHHTKAIRFDPATDYCVIKLKDVTATGMDGSEIHLTADKDGSLYRKKALYVFATSDPWITFKTQQSCLQKIRFTLEYKAVGNEAYLYILEKRYHIVKEQSKQIGFQRDLIEFHKRLIIERDHQIKVKDQQIQNKDQQIQNKNQLIQEQTDLLKTWDNHIHHIEAELNRIQSSLSWKIISLPRASKRAVVTLRNEGFGALWNKIRNYLRRSTRGKVSEQEKTEHDKTEQHKTDYERWLEKNAITRAQRDRINSEIIDFAYKPKISIVMPVYNVAQVWLQKAIESVLAQLYENWELCIADDASTEAHIRPLLEKYAAGDERIKVNFLEVNQGISLASNAALAMATGEFVGLLDNDDELSEDALYQNLKLLNTHPDADMIYSDEDKLDMNGKRCEPFFKPDWSPDYFRSLNYIAHFTVIRKSIIDDIDGFRPGFEGAQDYDLYLRVVEKTKKIYHIPKILYHWRKLPGSTAASLNNKSVASAAGKRALMEHLERTGIAGQVDIQRPTNYRIRYEIGENRSISTVNGSDAGRHMPLVAVIIPFKNKETLLAKCVNSILEKTTYPNYEVLLVSNNTEEPGAIQYAKRMEQDHSHISMVEMNIPFNFSKINNCAARKALGSYLVFLNNDTEIISESWITEMLRYAQLSHVGAVGIKMVFPSGKIQHGGITMGVMGGAWNCFWNAERDNLGYYHNLVLVRNCSAVSAACMMIQKDKFFKVGGFNEELAVGFNDVDLCLKLVDSGLFNVFVPYVELVHDESSSRGADDADDEKLQRNRTENDYLQRVWKKYVENDPFYNPNLSRESPYFDIAVN